MAITSKLSCAIFMHKSLMCAHAQCKMRKGQRSCSDAMQSCFYEDIGFASGVCCAVKHLEHFCNAGV